MTELVIRVVSNVLRHIPVKNLKGGDIGRISSVKDGRGLSTRNVNVFPKGYSPEFPVLLPQIALEDFGGGEKSQDGCIAAAERSATFCGCLWRRADKGRARCQKHRAESQSSQKRTPR